MYPIRLALSFCICIICIEASDLKTLKTPSTTAASINENDGISSNPERFKMVDFEWESVQAAYTVSIWILLASIAKILFHVNKQFGDAFPDSACLIVVGLLLGFVLTQFNVNSSFFSFDSHIFFLYLLPPIIFDAGYFMPNRQLFDNLDINKKKSNKSKKKKRL